jgi:hypothetical protein
MDTGIQPDIRFCRAKDEHTLCNPPVNVVSPEPRRSPSRGSLSVRPGQRISHRKSPARAGLSKQGVGIVSPTLFDCPNEDVGIRTAPPGFDLCGTRTAYPAFLLHRWQGARPLERDDFIFESSSRSSLSVEHDLFRKPVSTFRDHALTAWLIPVRCNCEAAMLSVAVGHPRMRVLTGVILAALLVSACSGSSRVEHVVPAWANPGPASHVGRKPSPDANSRAIAEPQPTAQPAVPQPAAQPAVRAPAAAHSPSEE